MSIPENSLLNWQERQKELVPISKHPEEIIQIEQKLMNPITEEEILQVIKSTLNDKVPGPTGIQYEVLKQLPIQMIKELASLYNQIL